MITHYHSALSRYSMESATCLPVEACEWLSMSCSTVRLLSFAIHLFQAPVLLLASSYYNYNNFPGLIFSFSIFKTIGINATSSEGHIGRANHRVYPILLLCLHPRELWIRLDPLLLFEERLHLLWRPLGHKRIDELYPQKHHDTCERSEGDNSSHPQAYMLENHRDAPDDMAKAVDEAR